MDFLVWLGVFTSLSYCWCFSPELFYLGLGATTLACLLAFLTVFCGTLELEVPFLRRWGLKRRFSTRKDLKNAGDEKSP
jgi:hypothetical protein